MLAESVDTDGCYAATSAAEPNLCELIFTAEDQQLLVLIVQQLVRGSKDVFKAFLQSPAAKVSKQAARRHDPKGHDWDVLAGFVASLTNPRQLAMVQQIYQWDRQHKVVPTIPGKSEGNANVYPQDCAVWELIRLTEAHPQYSQYRRLSSTSPGWIRTPRVVTAAAREPRLFGLDCEMAATTKDDRALVAVGVVGESGITMMDMLVQPPDPITDLRSEITGFETEDFENVKTTLEQARHLLLKQMHTWNPVATSDPAGMGQMPVLVGHALHHDLHALKLDYWPVIDTAMLFSLKDLDNATPGLAHLIETVLKRPFRQSAEGHHSHVEDAKAALELAQHRLVHGPSPPLPPPDRKRSLLVHRLPLSATQTKVVKLFDGGKSDLRTTEEDTADWVSVEHRIAMITGDALADAASPSPTLKSALVKPKRFRTVTVQFADVATASAAFKALGGMQGVDSIGRPQKDGVPFPGGGRRGITVRKFAAHGGQTFGKDSTAKQRRRKSRKNKGRETKRRRASSIP